MKHGIFSLIILLMACFVSSANDFVSFDIISQIKTAPKFPNFTVTIQAKNRNGAIKKIDSNSVVIHEMNNATKPSQIIDNLNGTYTINWVSKLQNRCSSCDIICATEAGTGRCIADYPNSSDLSMPFVRILTPNETPKVYFPQPVPGDSTQMRITFRPTNLTPLGDGSDIPVRIDSIKTHSPFFSCTYYGNYMSWNPPPFDAYSIEYPVFLYFKGYDDTLYTDKFSVYYNGGQVTEVDLIANSYSIPTENLLTITKPLPGDILTPCFQDTIKWTGAVSGLTSHVEFSSNGGITWRELGTTLNNYLLWTIPNDISENALIRVYQKFSKQGNYRLLTESGYSKCTWSDDAEHLVATTNDGHLHEWTVQGTTPTLISDYNLLMPGGFRYPDEQALVSGLTIWQEDGNYKYAASYSSSFMPEVQRNDTLATFSSGVQGIDNTVFTTKGFTKYKRLGADNSRNAYLTLEEDGSSVLSIDNAGNTTSFASRIPIRDFKKVNGRDSLLLLLQSNEIIIFDLTSSAAVDTLDFSSQPIIDQFSMSPNGELLAIATMIPPTDPNYALNLLKVSQTHIYNVESMSIVRSYYGAESDAMGLDFNPASNKLIRASRFASAPAHVMLYDLSADMPADYFNFSGDLINYSFAPEGHNVAVITDDGVLTITQFTYTESEIMDGYFSIRFADISYNPVEISARYIDTRLDSLLTSGFINEGELPLLVSNIYFKYGRNFSLNNVPSLPDTLFGGERYDINFVYNPIDTGLIVDTLIIETCATQYLIPFTSRGLPRNIEFCESVFDFGEACIGNIKKEKIKLLKNLDPVPLNINFVYFYNNEGNIAFSLPDGNPDTIIAPGEYYWATIGFLPTVRGLNTATCSVNHSKQGYMVPTVEFRGVGLGADVELSHQVLNFIPEIKTREITIKNLENTPFNITNYSISPEGSYILTNPLPAEVKSGESIKLRIEYLGDEPSTATLTLETYPCISQAIISLVPFSDDATITLSDTDADPREKTAIKINLESTSADKYRGERFINSEIIIDAAIFLPDSVISGFGKGEITRNEVIGDKRHIGFSILGDFPKNGIIGEITGFAGLAMPTVSDVTFADNTELFGRYVNCDTKDAKFRLINLCGDKIIIPEKRQLSIISVYPNPVNESFTLDFEADFAGDGKLEILDNLGKIVLSLPEFKIHQGRYSVSMSAGSLSSGYFNGIIKYSNGMQSFTIIKTK